MVGLGYQCNGGFRPPICGSARQSFSRLKQAVLHGDLAAEFPPVYRRNRCGTGSHCRDEVV